VCKGLDSERHRIGKSQSHHSTGGGASYGRAHSSHASRARTRGRRWHEGVRYARARNRHRAGDRLVYAKGFGTRGKADPAPVDTRTVFQIGSVAKSFLATTMAIAVDRGTLRWDDRVVDLHRRE
jgi:CubicO group peptidase (beta-lactamase class C family)